MSNSFLSIIIPCYEEHAIIIDTVTNLKQTAPDAEIIIVDSSAWDHTATLIKKHFPNVIYQSAIGSGKRNENMNEGAQSATRKVLMFHHADSRLPTWAGEILANIDWETTPYWWFMRKLTPQIPATLLADWFGRFFVRLHWFFLGDNSIVITKKYFDSLWWYRDKPLFEDVDLMQRARKWLQSWQNRKIIKTPVLSSSRKFTKYGWWKMFFLMLRLEIIFYLGGDVVKMEEEYRNYR